MLGALKSQVRTRGLAVAVAALAAIAAAARTDPPPPRTVEGVAEALGRAAGGTVRPDDFLWEARGGFIEDAFLGRHVLFLASPSAGSPRDLYRARVRLTRNGRPISVRSVHNLTRTPLGDDRDLTGAGHHIAFATSTNEGVLGITLLDLEGDPLPAAPVSRALTAIDRWLTTGSLRGLARTEVAFTAPPSDARLEVASTALVMSLGPEPDALPAAVDLSTHALQTGRTNPFGAVAQPLPAPSRPVAEVLPDLLARTFGDTPAAALRALLRRAPAAPLRAPPPAPPDGLRLGADYPVEAGWPPEPLATPSLTPFDGEGFWHVSRALYSERHTRVVPAIVESMIRPDTNNPTATIHLIAIDTRRIELRLIPGTTTPVPATGPHGSGRWPAPPNLPDPIAAFAAGPPASSEPLGFQAEGRLFAPFVPGAPALAVRPDGRAALGPWTDSTPRDAFLAVTQAPDALAAPSASAAPSAPDAPSASDAQFLPADPAAKKPRAALCRTSQGYLIYAFTPAAPAASLRAGLTLAGCTAAVHLGAAPSPLGFAYLATDESGTTATLASSSMTMPSPLALPAPHELIALYRRDLKPPVASPKAPQWKPDPGAQPIPTWLPAIHAAESEELGAKVTLLAFLPDRLHFRLATGADETTLTRGQKPGPPAADRTSALAAFGLSVARKSLRRGLLIDGTLVARPAAGPAADHTAWLIFRGSHVTLTRPGDPAPTAGDAAQLTLIADDHALLPTAREVGTQRFRGALCTLPGGTVLLAHATFDTDEAPAQALLDAGCDRIVSLDRGAHDGIFIARTTTPETPETAPAPAYDATTLYITPALFTGTAGDL
ncbi:MAG: hypothetical protein R3F14_45160 [Polyangiaceae bacterium]